MSELADLFSPAKGSAGTGSASSATVFVVDAAGPPGVAALLQRSLPGVVVEPAAAAPAGGPDAPVPDLAVVASPTAQQDVAQVRERWPGVPIIVVAADGDAGRRAGGPSLFVLPGRPGALVRAVATTLRSVEVGRGQVSRVRSPRRDVDADSRRQGPRTATVSRNGEQQARQRAQRHLELTYALERDELMVLYQPIVDAVSGAAVDAEALMRWRHPRLGTVPPSAFMEIAESSGLVVRLGAAVLRRACADAVRWSHAGASADLSVNLSARQLSSARITDTVLSALAEAGLPARRLVLEVTETAALDEPERATACLQELRDAGVRVALDDFGTGYSTLATLRQMPVDRLKIDGCFVREVAVSPRDRAIVSSVLALAQDLGMDVVAEQVETAEQSRVLLELGCRLQQGFLFARPGPVEDLPRVPAHRSAGRTSLQAAAGVEPLAQQQMRHLALEGASHASIAAALNAQGHRTPTGVRWHGRSVARYLPALA